MKLEHSFEGKELALDAQSLHPFVESKDFYLFKNSEEL